MGRGTDRRGGPAVCIDEVTTMEQFKVRAAAERARDGLAELRRAYMSGERKAMVEPLRDLGSAVGEILDLTENPYGAVEDADSAREALREDTELVSGR